MPLEPYCAMKTFTPQWLITPKQHCKTNQENKMDEHILSDEKQHVGETKASMPGPPSLHGAAALQRLGYAGQLYLEGATYTKGLQMNQKGRLWAETRFITVRTPIARRGFQLVGPDCVRPGPTIQRPKRKLTMNDLG